MLPEKPEDVWIYSQNFYRKIYALTKILKVTLHIKEFFEIPLYHFQKFSDSEHKSPQLKRASKRDGSHYSFSCFSRWFLIA